MRYFPKTAVIVNSNYRYLEFIFGHISLHFAINPNTMHKN